MNKLSKYLHIKYMLLNMYKFRIVNYSKLYKMDPSTVETVRLLV